MLPPDAVRTVEFSSSCESDRKIRSILAQTRTVDARHPNPIRALIVMLLAGVAGLVFRPIVNPDISYGSLVRLAAMGLTLSTYIDTGMELSDRDISFPFWFFSTVALTSLYVVFGARAGAPSLPAAFDDDFAEPPRIRGDEPRGDAPPDAFRA